MSIKVGDTLPEGTLTRMTESGPAPVTTRELFQGKRVLLIGVPGAFTPTCTNEHLPGYLSQLDAIKAKGVDTIACLAVNDVFVLDEWAKATGASGRILMLADGNGTYTRALGLDVDLTAFGMGTRARRFSLVADDGVVSDVNVESGPEVTVSGADATAGKL